MGTGRGEKVVGGRRRGGGWRVPTRPAGTSALTPPLRGGPASRPHPCTLGYGLGPGGGTVGECCFRASLCFHIPCRFGLCLRF